MGAPILKWKSFCKDNGIHVLTFNYGLYGDVSSRVKNDLKQFTPEVEVYSIDESFLQFKVLIITIWTPTQIKFEHVF